MPLHPFCDICRGPAPERTNRRWVHLQGEIGLEVIPMRGEKSDGQTYICDCCILKMFWAMMEQTPETGIKARQQQLDQVDAKAIQIRHRETELAQRVASANAKEDELAALEEKLTIERHELIEQKSTVEQIIGTFSTKAAELKRSERREAHLRQREAEVAERERELERQAESAARLNRQLADRDRQLDAKAKRISNMAGANAIEQLSIFNARHAEELHKARHEGKQLALDYVDRNSQSPETRRAAINNLRRELGR